MVTIPRQIIGALETNMTTLLNAFCDKHSLEHLSADELLHERMEHANATEEQKSFLQEFIKAWDAICTMDRLA